MKNYALLFLLISIISLSAQQKSFQLDIGANHSWFIYEEDFFDDFNENFKPMFTIGARYTFMEFDNFKISGGLRYFALERELTIDFEPYNGSTFSIDHYLLSMPFQISYLIYPINTSIIFNLEPAYILQSNVKDISPFGSSSQLQDRNISDEVNRFQFAIGGGLEYKFDLFDQSFGVKSIYNYFLTDVPKSGTFTRDGAEYGWASYKGQEASLVLSYYF